MAELSESRYVHEVGKNRADTPKKKQISSGQELKLQSYEWFHGKLTRAEAEKKLLGGKNGEFLVRESKNFAGDLTLSVQYASRVEHYRILCGKQSFFTIDNEVYFENIAKLIEYYEEDRYGLCTRLKFPVKKSESPGSSNHELHLLPSDLLVKYRDISKKQAAAEVWQGDYIGQQVVIKTVNCSAEQISKLRQKLGRISFLLSSIQHENLASFIGISMDESNIYFVTKHIVKGALVNYLRSRGRKHYSNEKLIHLACEICAGMSHLESLKFVHGNLTAHNVLLDDNNIVKVTDFGITQVVEDILQLKGTNASVRWRAPEVLTSKAFSSKADVWSFGVVLWELFSYGRVPYPGKTAEEIPLLLESDLRMSSPEQCPESVYQIMLRTWHKLPAHRPTFTELNQYLQGMVKQTSPKPSHS